MYKFLFLFASFLALTSNAIADICYDISKDVANKAVNIIQKQKEIFEYCSICPKAEARTIPVIKLQSGSPIYVNGIALDLAHTYYKQDGKFINLGIATKCIKNGDYNIAAKLDNLPNINRNKKTDKLQATKFAQEIYQQCVEKFQYKETITTAIMVERNIKINDCITEAITQEIEKGFNPEQQKEMIEALNQIRKAVWKFYFGIYTENKYCYGTCGTITNILPYPDEGKILMDMLEKVIYLNLSQNGY